MTEQNPVSFAIASPARWGRLLLDAASKSALLQMAGVWSRNEANRNDILNTYGGRSYASFEEMLADETVEAVLLPTPHFLHHPQAIASFAAGKHVFVEKPIANSIGEAEEMRDTALRKNLVLAVGLQHRWVGSARKVKALIENGDLGDIALATAALGATLMPQYSDDAWELDPEKIPGGPLDNLAVHYADLLLYFLGPVKRVMGHVSNRLSPTAVPSIATASLEFESGVLATLMTHQISAYLSEISIFGTKAAVHYKRAGQELFWQEIIDPVRAKHIKPKIEPLKWDGPENFTTALKAELEDFARCIRNGSQPQVGAAEGIAALRLIRAIMESSTSGTAVEFARD